MGRVRAAPAHHMGQTVTLSLLWGTAEEKSNTVNTSTTLVKLMFSILNAVTGLLLQASLWLCLHFKMHLEAPGNMKSE